MIEANLCGAVLTADDIRSAIPRYNQHPLQLWVSPLEVDLLRPVAQGIARVVPSVDLSPGSAMLVHDDGKALAFFSKFSLSDSEDKESQP